MHIHACARRHANGARVNYQDSVDDVGPRIVPYPFAAAAVVACNTPGAKTGGQIDCILSPGLQHDLLHVAVCLENEVFIQYERTALVVRIDGDLGENIHTVVGRNFQIGETVAGNTIHVQVETGLVTFFQFKGRDAYALAVAIVYLEIARGRPNLREHRVESQGVGAELQLVLRISGKALFLAGGQNGCDYGNGNKRSHIEWLLKGDGSGGAAVARTPYGYHHSDGKNRCCNDTANSEKQHLVPDEMLHIHFFKRWQVPGYRIPCLFLNVRHEPVDLVNEKEGQWKHQQ